MLQYDFMVNALVVGLILGILLPTIGVFVLFKRLSFIADSFGHINMSAIAFTLFLTSVFPIVFQFKLIITLFWIILSALLIEYLRERYKSYREISIMIVYSISIVLTMIFINLNSSYKSSVLELLFGNINSISRQELIFTTIFVIVLGVFFFKTYKKFLIIALEEEYSKMYGINARLYNYILMVIISLSITIAIKVVGVLLVSSLLIIPLISASNLTKNLKNTWLMAMLITTFSIISGIMISFKFNIQSSVIIVGFTIIIYIYSNIAKKM